MEELAALLRRRGHRLSLFTRDNRDIEDLSPVARLRLPADTVWSPHTYREARRWVEKVRPDVAHVHNVFPLLSPSLYAALGDAGVPIVQTVHNFRFLCPNGLFYTQGEICERCRDGDTRHAVRLRCYRDSYAASAIYALAVGGHRRRGTFDRIDRFIAQTRFTRSKLIQGRLATPLHIDLVPPLVRTTPQPRPPSKPPYALYLGRLSEEKGPRLLLDAFADLPERRLLIAGDGPLLPELRREVERRRLDNVTLAGYLGGAEKEEALAAAYLLVAPSRCYEAGFNLSAVEGLAAGVPVVASDLGGLKELVDDSGGGLLFRAGDAGSLAFRVEEMFSKPELRHRRGAAGRHHVETQFDEATHHRRLVACYRAAITRRHQRHPGGLAGLDRRPDEA